MQQFQQLEKVGLSEVVGTARGRALPAVALILGNRGLSSPELLAMPHKRPVIA